MEISITDITEVEKEIQIQTTAAELIPHFEEAYKRQQQKIEIRGFRKGKAPLDLVKKLHGESIEYSALDTIASAVYRQVVQERDLRPIGDPVLTDMDYKRGEALTFKIKYEVKPQIELKEYKGIALERLIHTVTEKEIQDELLRLRKANGTLEEASSAESDEYIVTADIQQLDASGSPLIGKRTTDARLYLADDAIFPEIKSALRNATVGLVAKADIDHEHDGVKHSDHLEITVKKIERALLPDFSDEFVKKITKEKLSSVAAFDEQLRSDLASYWAERSERKLVDAMVAEIVRRHQITVPESLVKGVLDSLVEEMKGRYPNKKLPPEFNEETFRTNSRGYAIFQASWYLIRERIIEAEHLTVEDSEVEKLAETDAPKVGIDNERLLQFYRTSNQVKDRILSDKLMAFLKANQAITEKATEEFFD
jgi:trigger factor